MNAQRGESRRNKVTEGLCTEDSEGDGREERMMSREELEV
jgi:hypothetical protein